MTIAVFCNDIRSFRAWAKEYAFVAGRYNPVTGRCEHAIPITSYQRSRGLDPDEVVVSGDIRWDSHSEFHQALADLTYRAQRKKERAEKANIPQA